MADHPEKIGKYEVAGVLGRGATGIVYLASDPFANRQVAVKVARPELADDPADRQRRRQLFLNEASLVGKLHHPHIVEVFDAETTDEASYLVMEYVPGGTLAQFTRVDTLLALDAVVDVVFKCCTALEYAQRHGLIHRDLKPANILMTGESDIKISDFGAALCLQSDVTQVSGTVGSPAYMSPEQLADGPLSFSSDVFALGVVMFQLITGRLPFEADTPYALMYKIAHEPAPPLDTFRSDLPVDLQPVVDRALAKQPEERYPSWSDFAADLATLGDVLGHSVQRIKDSEKFHRLRQIQFFQPFTDVELWEIIRIAQWGRAEKGRELVRDGSPGSSFYVIADGTVSVEKKGRQIARLGPGACFGEMAYLNPSRPVRSADVIALDRVLLLKIRGEALSHASEALQAKFNKVFLQILVNRLNEADIKLAGMY